MPLPRPSACTARSMPFLDIEKLVVKAVKSRQLHVHNLRIDHQAGCIRFGEAVMEHVLLHA